MIEDICEADDRIEYLSRFGQEILALEKQRQEMLVSTGHRRFEPVVVLGLLSLNSLLFLVFPPYILGWITCSLLLLALYPLTMLVPSLIRWMRVRTGNREKSYLKTLQSLHLMRTGEQFIHILWNIFFINLRSVGTALVIFCGINLLAAVTLFLVLHQEMGLAAIITGQFFLFFTVFLLSLVLKPYSRRFEVLASAVTKWVQRRGPLVWGLLSVIGFTGLILTLFLLSAYLFPGNTAMQLMEREELRPSRVLLQLLILLLSQFLIVRYIHSLQSRRTTRRISESLERFVRDDVLVLVDRARSGEITAESVDCSRFRQLMTGLLEAKMYRTVTHGIGGFFLLYLFSPDFSQIMDDETLRILVGHMSIQERRER
ncbi:MAG: hypothetical protein LUO91_03090 [Methanomicrobiales archaeon]|nr:hypothetical protein [Methanomicrobiales archaeon]